MFPRSCHICGEKLAPSEHYICLPCLSRMPRTLYHRQSDNPMEQRFMGIIPYERATGHFFYSRGSDLATLIQDFKYRKFPGLARYLGSVVATELLTTDFLSDIDIIIPVPMHVWKQARRGYNQAAEVAHGLAEVVGLPVSTALKAVRSHRTQTSMTLDARRKNVSGMFRLDNPDSINDRYVLLVDDVCTTGATLLAASEAILAAAPEARITLLTLGVTF